MTVQPYLTLTQIESILERVGQPEGSELLNRFFTGYRRQLTSDDVRDLYDARYFEHLAAHPVTEVVCGFEIHQFAWHAFDYLRTRVPGKSVLDFGCGHGEVTLALAATGASNVVGIDADRELVEAARVRAPHGLPVTFEVASALHADGIFDYALLNDVTEHLSDSELAQVLTEIGRVLRPGGELVIHTPNGLALCNRTDATLASRVYVAYLRRLRGWRGFDRTAEQIYYDQVHINIKSFRQLHSLLDTHGFAATVRYDERPRFGPGWLSSNMLVIATTTERAKPGGCSTEAADQPR